MNSYTRFTFTFTYVKKGKGVCKLFMEIHLTATECHLPYGITQCYLPPDTSEHTPPLPQPDRLVLDRLVPYVAERLASNRLLVL